MAEATKATDHTALKARASKLVKNKQGKLVSKRSKTQDAACSQAMSQWKTSGMTPTVAATLGKCRAKARLLREGATRREMGQEARAQAMESRANRGGPLTAKDRLAKAKELRTQRAQRGESTGVQSAQSDKSRRKPRNKAEREVAAMGAAREARIRRYGERTSMGKVAAADVEARDVVMLRDVRSRLAASKRERRAQKMQAAAPAASQPATPSPAATAAPRVERARRKTEGVPVKDWDGSIARTVPFADRVAERRAELQQRRQARAQERVILARNERYGRLGAVLPESISAVGRDRLARARELRAQRASRTATSPTPTAAALRTTVTSGPTDSRSRPGNPALRRELASQAREIRAAVMDPRTATPRLREGIRRNLAANTDVATVPRVERSEILRVARRIDSEAVAKRRQDAIAAAIRQRAAGPEQAVAAGRGTPERLRKARELRDIRKAERLVPPHVLDRLRSTGQSYGRMREEIRRLAGFMGERRRYVDDARRNNITPSGKFVRDFVKLAKKNEINPYPLLRKYVGRTQSDDILKRRKSG